MTTTDDLAAVIRYVDGGNTLGAASRHHYDGAQVWCGGPMSVLLSVSVDPVLPASRVTPLFRLKEPTP